MIGIYLLIVATCMLSAVAAAIMFRERLTPIGYVSAGMIIFGIVFIRAFGTL